MQTIGNLIDALNTATLADEVAMARLREADTFDNAVARRATLHAKLKAWGAHDKATRARW